MLSSPKQIAPEGGLGTLLGYSQGATPRDVFKVCPDLHGASYR